MKLILTTSTFPSGEKGDGTPRFILDLALALSNKCEIKIIAPSHPNSNFGKTSQDHIEGIEITRFNYFYPKKLQKLAYANCSMKESVERSFLAKVQIPMFFASQYRALSSLCKSFSPEIVNAHWMIPQGLVAARVKKDFNYKLITSIHGGDFKLLTQTSLGKKIITQTLTNSEHAILPNASLEKDLRESYSYHNTSIQPMGVNLEKFSSAINLPINKKETEQPYLLFVGRFSQKKGINILLSAFAKTSGSLRLILAGYGALEEEIRNQIKTLNISERVDLIGKIDHRNLPDLYNNALATIIPSITTTKNDAEGLPTVLFEAMACKSLIIASNIPGITEVIKDGENGLLFPAEDSSALFEKITWATNNNLSQIRENAFISAKKYEWGKVAEKYYQIFTETLKPRSR
jgi:glycosyltransferase involved in cell wall biosynthesis